MSQVKFVPKRLIVTRQVKDSARTNEIIGRVRALNPDIPIIEIQNMHDDPAMALPDAAARWRYRHESLVLADRSSPFITTFASPGDIVEGIGTVLHLNAHCAFDCEYCYLQAVMPPHHIIHTNTDRLETEIAIEPYVHRAILTLWTGLSVAQKRTFMKVPENFHKAADYLRLRFQQEAVSTDAGALEVLYRLTRSADFFQSFLTKRGMNAMVRKTHLLCTKQALEKYYDKNRRFRPRLNIGEYTDFLAIEHIARNVPLLMELLHQQPDIEITFRTKGLEAGELLQRDGDNRVTIAIGLNTEYVIDRYEHGTPPLEERLALIRSIQAARGFRLRIVVEPVIRYDRWIHDYSALVRRVVGAIDPTQVTDFTFGTVRYSGKLKSLIGRNFPNTDLLAGMDGMQKAIGDTKIRYPLSDRLDVYRAMIAEVKRVAPTAIIRLGAETATAWNGLGLNPSDHLKHTVFQFTGTKRKPHQRDRTTKACPACSHYSTQTKRKIKTTQHYKEKI